MLSSWRLRRRDNVINGAIHPDVAGGRRLCPLVGGTRTDEVEVVATPQDHLTTVARGRAVCIMIVTVGHHVTKNEVAVSVIGDLTNATTTADDRH